MNNKYTVSVILPNYNHSKYLNQRIDSILNQSYQDFELIILDDKSPDNSVEIIESYRGHEKITHIVINEQNSGSTFNQWDKGFSLAQGKYIWIAESDDYADLTLLEKCVSALEKSDKAVLCYTDSHFVDENGNNVKHWISKLIIDDKAQAIDGAVTYKGVDYMKSYLFDKNYLYNASMILFRRDAIGTITPFYKTFKGCGDWIFWGEMILKSELIHIPEKLNYFRQHTNKVSHNMTSNHDYFFDDVCTYSYLLKLFEAYTVRNGIATYDQIKKFKIQKSKFMCNLLSCYINQSKRSKACYDIRLFGLVPLYSIKHKLKYEKHYLFGLIPILKKKHSSY